MSRFRSKRNRLGFTLVELLVVVALVSIVSGMLAAALSSAQQDAAARRGKVELLNYGQILQTRLAAIAFTSIDTLEAIDRSSAFPVGGLATSGTPASVVQQDEARVRMLARRDFARMVLPECQADLFYPPASLQYRAATNPASGSVNRAYAQIAVPARWNRMRQQIGLADSTTIDDLYGPSNPTLQAGVDAIELFRTDTTFRSICTTSSQPIAWTREYESAECLYLILSTYEALNRPIIDQIPERSIGDLDGDGVNEILDPWGTPVVFIRSPIGFNGAGLANINPNAAAGGKDEFRLQPDAFDFLLTDFRSETSLLNLSGSNGVNTTYASAFQPVQLPPIIISAGPDREFGIRTPELNDAFYSSSAVTIEGDRPTPSFGGPYRFPDPFFPVGSGRTAIRTVGNDRFTGIVLARRGTGEPDSPGPMGLGGILPNGAEAAADNLTSIDTDL